MARFLSKELLAMFTNVEKAITHRLCHIDQQIEEINNFEGRFSSSGCNAVA